MAPSLRRASPSTGTSGAPTRAASRWRGHGRCRARSWGPGRSRGSPGRLESQHRRPFVQVDEHLLGGAQRSEVELGDGAGSVTAAAVAEELDDVGWDGRAGEFGDLGGEVPAEADDGDRDPAAEADGLPRAGGAGPDDVQWA